MQSGDQLRGSVERPVHAGDNWRNEIRTRGDEWTHDSDLPTCVRDRGSAKIASPGNANGPLVVPSHNPTEFEVADHMRSLWPRTAVALFLLTDCPHIALAQVEVNPSTATPERSTDPPTVVPAYMPDVAHTQPTPSTPGSVAGVVEPVPERSTSAEAPPAPKAFGDAGVAVLSGSVSVSSSRYSNSDATHLTVFVEPGVDYFVDRPLSIGGYALGRYGDNKSYDYFGPLVETKDTGYGFGARIGFNIPVGKLLSIWPKLAFGMNNYHITRSVQTMPSNLVGIAPSQSEESTSATWIELQVPLLFHAATHYFVGFGPTVYTDVSRNATFVGSGSQQNRGTGISLTLTTGGWI